jgi:hypothetical protein
MPSPLTINGALARLLLELRGRDFAVLLNGGSRGDGVTHLGGRQLLEKLGIIAREFREADDLSHLQGDVLLIHGAGAMARRTRSFCRMMRSVAPRFTTVVLLPSTFDLEVPQVRAFAEMWDSKYHVFCREVVSFGALQAAQPRPKKLLLGQDLAFHADLTEWAGRPAAGRAGIFRRDAEAGYGKLPRNFDVCEDASYGSAREPERLLDFVARFSEIHTDRSHAAIVGAMMKRKVVFYRNSYFKNQAIYDHSLAPLPHVRFVRRTPFSFSQFSRAVYWTRVQPVKRKMRHMLGGREPSAVGA